ncbi:glycosyltransferase [Klebsiella aerogenes]|uniref:glycosyltransferase n=1 Tax=Klebsiella aerogenes TaxID=548 RepID=UPI00292CCAC5|nr:glycosyltransferase [Klebsiella aerogenes]
MSKRKIAIYNLNTYPEMSGGSERSCLELAMELQKLGEDVSVVTLNPFRKGFEKIRYKSVEIYKLPLLNVYWPTSKKKKSIFSKIIWNIIDIANIPMCLLLSIYLKKMGVNVVHTNNIKGMSPLIFPMLKMFGLKVIHTTRDYYLLDSGAWYRSLDSNHNSAKIKMKRVVKLLMSTSLDYVVYNSNYMKQYHESCGFFKSIPGKVIYNGFDPNIYQSVNKKNKIEVFGFIGRVTEEKGVDLLVSGFLKFNNGDYKLLIAGATLEDFLTIYPGLREKLSKRTDIEFLGIINNITFFDLVDCVVVPSRYNEPFGRVAMESIFMGKSVIVSDRGGLPEQIVAGVSGIVCSDSDYYGAMTKLINKNNVTGNEQSPDLDMFTINYSTLAYLEVYKEVSNDFQ